MNKALRVVFLGTPDFAVTCLKKLYENHINLVAVVTVPDKPQGRGKKLKSSPVKDYALAKNIPLLQPTNLKSKDFIAKLEKFRADIQIVVAFRMLPKTVWNMPELGTFNLHASLLPQYRGATPIHWAIINGEKTTGVTTFFLQHEIDTGDIFFQEKIPISKKETAGSLHEKLERLGADLVLKTLRAIENNDCHRISQQIPMDKKLKLAPKITKEDAKINWGLPAKEIIQWIRGMNPFPGAWTEIGGKGTKIYDAEINTLFSLIDLQNKNILTDYKTYFSIKSSDGFVSILDIQMEGKKRMKIADFLKGYRFKEI